MEVKDVQRTVLSPSSIELGSKQISSQSLSAGPALPEDSAPVQIDSASNPETLKANQVRDRTNEVISVANVATQATSEIEKLVKSISGIVEQVSSEQLPQSRTQILEQEANSLVEEIKKRAETQAPSGVRPLAGDPIRLEVEEKLGKSLDFLLPNDAKDAFGLGNIQFSTKDFIINTVINVRTAEHRIQELREAVTQSVEQLKSTVSTLDVASQNVEASQVSVRDVDSALNLAQNTKLSIRSNPGSAISSAGKLTVRSLDLLK